MIEFIRSARRAWLLWRYTRLIERLRRARNRLTAVTETRAMDMFERHRRKRHYDDTLCRMVEIELDLKLPESERWSKRA